MKPVRSGKNTKTIAVLVALSAFALVLAGSREAAAGPGHGIVSKDLAEVRHLGDAAVQLYKSGRYIEARDAFRAVAQLAEKRRLKREAAWYWNNVAACSLVLLQYRAAVEDLLKAKFLAESVRQMESALAAANNLASTYIHLNQPANAVQISTQALANPEIDRYPSTRAILRCQLAGALEQQRQFDAAELAYKVAINDLIDQSNLHPAMLALAALGSDSIDAGRLSTAEWALCEALRLARQHGFQDIANVLDNLGQLRGRQGDVRAATDLFDAALSAPPGGKPRWGLYMDRGRFRSVKGDAVGALADFREARRIAAQMRADMVPADQDRIAFESGRLNWVFEGFVDSGNRVARQTGNAALLRETFDVAEQDRLWSLRALVPSPNDWRTRLPPNYWTLLAKYQSVQRTAVSQPTAKSSAQAELLQNQLQQIEAQAAGPTTALEPSSAISVLDHIQRTLSPDSLLLSFHVTGTSSWVWAVDRGHVATWQLPPLSQLSSEIAEFRRQLTASVPSEKLGAKLYSELFGQIPSALLDKPRWLLELDGPLHELPFAALVIGSTAGRGQDAPTYLVDRVALQSIPSAMLLQRSALPGDGALLAVGDPVYNVADVRYRGKAGAGYALPRLPNTAAEAEASAASWNPSKSEVLIGNAATLEGVRVGLRRNPAIIHFATHVVSAPGDFNSGMIALGLDASGSMGLLGPKEIVARPVTASLVVMDGCHSAQGESLPSSGLMGLTRAWIGAGAGGVLATQWDIPDEGARIFMGDFYAALRQSPEEGPAFALRYAQLSAKSKSGSSVGGKSSEPLQWAGYFLLSRLQ